MKSVLLTGGTGFVGSRAIVPLLERGYEVHAVTSQPETQRSEKNLFWHRANLLDFSQIETILKEIQPSHLLHFAWYLEHGKVWHAPENLDWLKASIHLAQKFVENGGQRMVAAGTLSEYETSEDEFISEDKVKLVPQTLYAATKAALFHALEKYSKEVNLSFGWGRGFFMFGKNESPDRLFPSVTCSLLKNEFARTSHGNQIRDYLATEEVADAYVALLDSEVQGAVNIGSGKPVTIKELVLQIAEFTGNAEKIMFGAIQPSMEEPPRVVADIRRLRNEVRWQAARSLSRQIEETVDWYRNGL